MTLPASPIPFTFGIPLISRTGARDWARVEGLLDLTLASILAQSDPDVRVIVAGHDRPRTLPDDRRIEFLAADWPAERPRPDNLDSGRKKHAINQRVLARGGGLLMFVDADDWVDLRTVETARRLIRPRHAGALITRGVAVDFLRQRMAPVPDPAVFAGDFHRICGSSTIAWLRPADPQPLHRDPYATLHDHHRWLETAEEHGAEILRLPVEGCYLVNTSENHSETHGPFAEWRTGLSDAVAGTGRPLDAAALARFGLTPGHVARHLPGDMEKAHHGPGKWRRLSGSS